MIDCDWMHTDTTNWMDVVGRKVSRTTAKTETAQENILLLIKPQYLQWDIALSQTVRWSCTQSRQVQFPMEHLKKTHGWEANHQKHTVGTLSVPSNGCSRPASVHGHKSLGFVSMSCLDSPSFHHWGNYCHGYQGDTGWPHQISLFLSHLGPTLKGWWTDTGMNQKFRHTPFFPSSPCSREDNHLGTD